TNNNILTQRNMISPLLHTGRAGEALALIRALRREALRDQFLLACESTALRAMGDAGYSALCDFERLLRRYEIAAPKAFFTKENFNAALAETLRAQLATISPLDRTLKNGVQTSRDLRQVNDPNFNELLHVVDAPFRRYISGLSAEDPVGRRRANGYRVRAMW